MPELCKFLNKLNPNIDWDKFLSTNIGLSDEKFIKKIKPLLWTNKDYDVDLGWYTTNQQNFYYYSKYISTLRNFGSVDILNVIENDQITGFITCELQCKIRVLQQILKFMGIQYNLVTIPEDVKSDILINTGSILYDTQTYKNITSKYKLVCHDSYFNIYSGDNYDKLCQIELIIYLLAFDPDVNLSGATHKYDDSVDTLLNIPFNIIRAM